MLNIAFVSNQENTLFGYVFFLSFAKIVITTLDSGFVREIEDTDTALRAFVVCTGESPELFLPCSIPDLKIVRFFVNSHRVGLEVDTHCGEIDCIKLGLAQSEEDRTLSNSLRADNNDFEGLSLDV